MVSAEPGAPPSYAAGAHLPTGGPRISNRLLDHAQSDLGLPHGLFMLQNRATGRVFDVRGGTLTAGSEIILFEPKTLVATEEGSLRDPRNNQLFFIDSQGALVSAAAGLHVAVANGELYLAPLQPILASSTHGAAEGFPPRFRLDPHTSTLHVLPHACSPAAVRSSDVDMMVEAVARPKVPGEGEMPWDAVTSFFSSSLSLVAGKGREAQQPAQSAMSSAAGDDSLDPMRRVRTVAFGLSWRDKLPEAVLANQNIANEGEDILRWRRRQWKAIAVGQGMPLGNDRVLFSASDEDARPLDVTSLQNSGM